MTIEFNCHVCGKLLRTGDDKAGRTAKCPGCGEALSVPSPEVDDAEDEYGDDDEADEEYNEFGEVPVPPSASGATQTCPMCGESISSRATRCEFCGEEVGATGAARRGDVRPTQVDVGEVISTSWELFKSEMGVCVGGYVIFVGILLAVAFARGMCTSVVNIGVAGMGNQQPNAGALGIVIGVAIVAAFIELAIRLYLEAGFKRLLLNVARGKHPEIGDIFGAGPFFLRYLGNSILFGLIVGFGTAFFIIPGIILALMFWPFSYLILDRNLPGVESLGRAKEITEGNWGSIFLLALAAIGINIVGFLAVCIGLIFTVPLTMLMFAVAYCRMSGRATARV